ncbi:hypothetical protein [Dokdonella soli]|uniref:Uncharacterized protein n=1 Tax=Dokdonella soli TaxID=529810 RepID=A0ABN1IKI4_9GAMM
MEPDDDLFHDAIPGAAVMPASFSVLTADVGAGSLLPPPKDQPGPQWQPAIAEWMCAFLGGTARSVADRAGSHLIRRY